MKQIIENKDAARIALLERLLDSDLAKQYLREDARNLSAVRRRAATVHVHLAARHLERVAKLKAQAQAAAERRDVLRAEFERAEQAARTASDSLEIEQMNAGSLNELRSIASAGEAMLERLGLTSVEALDRKFGTTGVAV